MTGPKAGIDGVTFSMALLNLAIFFGLLECWHQFRDTSGWVATAWLAGMFAAWIVSVVINREIALRRK